MGGVGRIRVAHVMHGLMMGGLEQMVVRLCAAGRQFGVDPLVIAIGRDGNVRDLLAEHDIPLVWLGEVRGMSPQAIQGIARALRENGTDVAHAHDFGPWMNVVAARALAPRVKTVVTFHQLATPSGFGRGAAIAASLVSGALVACGNEVFTCVRRWAPPGARLELIGNGVPIGPEPTPEARTAARRRMGIPETARVVGYIGRIHEEKGTDLLVDAFLHSLAELEDVHLVIVGKDGRTDHTFEPDLRALAEREGRGRVHFLGEIVNAPSLLAGFDVYAQPSRREGRSLSMLEAMAAALPTVAQALPPIREIHVDGETAALVAPAERPAFGPALRGLLGDPELRARMGNAARAHVQRFSIDVMARQYTDLYDELLASERKVAT